MSLETIGAFALKFGWSVFIPYILWIHKKDKTKLEDTYNKKEINDLIDLKLNPVKQSIINKHESLNSKFDLIMVMVKENNAEAKEQRKENARQAKDIQKYISDISENIAVMKNNLEHLQPK
jgi:Mg2+ and Co2+ transporter CorA